MTIFSIAPSSPLLSSGNCPSLPCPGAVAPTPSDPQLPAATAPRCPPALPALETSCRGRRTCGCFPAPSSPERAGGLSGSAAGRPRGARPRLQVRWPFQLTGPPSALAAHGRGRVTAIRPPGPGGANANLPARARGTAWGQCPPEPWARGLLRLFLRGSGWRLHVPGCPSLQRNPCHAVKYFSR